MHDSHMNQYTCCFYDFHNQFLWPKFIIVDSFTSYFIQVYNKIMTLYVTLLYILFYVGYQLLVASIVTELWQLFCNNNVYFNQRVFVFTHIIFSANVARKKTQDSVLISVFSQIVHGSVSIILPIHAKFQSISWSCCFLYIGVSSSLS